jgi:hypothetical protein
MGQRQSDKAALDMELPPARQRRTSNYYLPSPHDDKRYVAHNELNPRYDKSTRYDDPTATRYDHPTNDDTTRYHDSPTPRHDAASRHHTTNNRGLTILRLPRPSRGRCRGTRQRGSRVVPLTSNLCFERAAPVDPDGLPLRPRCARTFSTGLRGGDVEERDRGGLHWARPKSRGRKQKESLSRSSGGDGPRNEVQRGLRSVFFSW